MAKNARSRLCSRFEMLSLDLRKATVYKKLGSGHVTAVVGGQEGHDLCYFIGAAVPPQRSCLGSMSPNPLDLFII